MAEVREVEELSGATKAILGLGVLSVVVFICYLLSLIIRAIVGTVKGSK